MHLFRFLADRQLSDFFRGGSTHSPDWKAVAGREFLTEAAQDRRADHLGSEPDGRNGRGAGVARIESNGRYQGGPAAQ